MTSRELSLYPYQKTGVRFMRKHRKVLLADDMGLGKTVQATMAQLGSDLTLIVASRGMKYFWRDEIIRWTDCHEDWIHIPTDDIDPALREARKGFHIIHWDVLRLWPRLATIPWQAVIVDEAHKAKNRKAQRTKALWKICKDAGQVYLLTGTPIVNQPADLWALLKCLYPKVYTSYWRFYREHVLYAPTPWDPWGGEILGVRDPEKLQDELSTMVLRRTKATVMPELPEKQHTLIPVELHPAQLKAYREIRDYMLTEIDDETTITTPNVLSQLTRLRQVAVGLGAFKEGEEDWFTQPAAKIDAVVDYIEDTDSKVVVASQFVWATLTTAKRLRKKGVTAAVMYGDTPEEDRNRIVRQFQEKDDPRVLCMTVQTGGEGWTLTAADTLVFLDRPWSPQVVRQAEDRLHRIGQKSPVHIVTLIALGTIEERIEEVLGVKESIFNSVFGRFKELL